MTVTPWAFISKFETLFGLPYVYGAEVDLDDPHPAAVDCSEAVEWTAHQVGLYLPDGSSAQYEHCRDAGLACSINTAIATPAALLFIGTYGAGSADQHVALSLGNGMTAEARGKAYGVGSWSADPDVRGWTAAALIPGIAYGTAPTPPPPQEDDDMKYPFKCYRITDSTVYSKDVIFAVGEGSVFRFMSREEAAAWVALGLCEGITDGTNKGLPVTQGINQRQFDVGIKQRYLHPNNL